LRVVVAVGYGRLMLVATFSIVAHDAATRSWGVAVQSRFPFVGSVVPWGRAEVGAVATQAIANPRYGPLGLAMLHEGLTAKDVIGGLVNADAGRELRQVGVDARHGRAAAFTGAECIAWAGHVIGDGYVCLGNILAGAAVVDGMAAQFEKSREVPFAERLIGALEAGQAEGGDSRGQQAAALLIVRAAGGFAGYTDRAVDLRVDDHDTPIAELGRLLTLHRATFGSDAL
jgi:uncharacterized Ntn-hydrolase superfamily protein